MVKYELLERMQNGDKDAFIEGFSSKSAVDRTNAIIESTKKGLKDKAFIRFIKNLKGDDSGAFGNEYWRVKYFAFASLDLLGEEKYKGKEQGVIDLIDSGFLF